MITMLMVLMMSNQAMAGLKGSVAYENQSSRTNTSIPYTVCTPTCQTVSNEYSSTSNSNLIRFSVGYEQRIAGPVSVDVMGGTNLSLSDHRLETNLKYDVNSNLSIKAGINGHTERSDSMFKYSPGLGQQAGIEYKLPSQGQVDPFIDVKYYRMNTSYDVSGSNSINDVKKDAVSIGFGLSF